MARNSEKAQSMLFRFRAAQAAESGIIDIGRTKRPRAITSVSSIPECERWRGQVLREVSRKVTKIQDASLSDFQLRDLNDEINRLMREKYVWELRIRELGGPNYMRAGRVVDEEGREVPGGGKGYRYFGRARELPGVKELFEQAARQARPAAQQTEERELGRTRAELARGLDAAYFGYGLDEEDGTLVEWEGLMEGEFAEGLKGKIGEEAGEKPLEVLPGDVGDGMGWRLPSVEEVQEELVERRRRKLLEKLG